eukprot:COSAG02_NODE_533_length_20665_cov_216.617281_14_plen_173_part_00
MAQLGWKPISPVERGSAASRPLGQVGRRDASNARQFGPRYSEIMSDNINMADQRREQRRAGAVLRSSSPASRRPPLQKVAPSTSKTSKTVTKATAAGQPSTATMMKVSRFRHSQSQDRLGQSPPDCRRHSFLNSGMRRCLVWAWGTSIIGSSKAIEADWRFVRNLGICCLLD